MVLLYSNKICEITDNKNKDDISASLTYLKVKEKELLLFLIKNYKREFTPIEVSREFKVTNKTIINRLGALVKNGFIKPLLANKQIRAYKLSEFSINNENEIKKILK